MNMQEKINELGYHATGGDYHLTIYLHGNYVTELTRFERTYKWTNHFNKPVTIFTIKEHLEKLIRDKNV